jgi:hypothetical protein
MYRQEYVGMNNPTSSFFIQKIITIQKPLTIIPPYNSGSAAQRKPGGKII